VLDRAIPGEPGGAWWRLQLDLTRRALELADRSLLVGHPNLHENLDALADMTGAESLCYALADRPQAVERLVAGLDSVWMHCFEALYQIVVSHNGGACYAAKHVWGPGRTAKVQCDFAALISPDQFRRHVQPSLRRQCSRLDHSMFHLDGPAALRHLDAVLEIEELGALQFTPGAGNACASDPRWLPVYERAAEAGKSIQVELSGDSAALWEDNVARLVERLGAGRLYLVYPQVSERQADSILAP
jgi:5-methyltetrahydrofolate--homocysteine methyltransferase